MKNRRKFSKTTYLPRVRQSDIMGMMEASNISRMHLGLDPLPYLWYKRLLQLSRCGLAKYLEPKYSEVIIAYCNATRKQRRETKYMRPCYMMVMKLMWKEKDIDNKKNFLETLKNFDISKNNSIFAKL